MHPQFGIPQLYHDQMNVIAKHLWDIKNSPEWQLDINEELVAPIVDSQDDRSIFFTKCLTL